MVPRRVPAGKCVVINNEPRNEDGIQQFQAVYKTYLES
jgi:hypothetical protein